MAQQNIAYDDKVGLVTNPALDVNKVTDDDMNEIKGVVNANATDTQSQLDLKAPLASPTFTGTVSGITATMVGLGNVDNTSDADKPVSTAQATAISDKVSKTATADQTVASRLRAKSLSAGSPASSSWDFTASQVITAGNNIYLYSISGETGICQNSAWNGTNWEYVTTGTALRTVYGASGSLIHYNAVSGTATNPITWVQTHTIDASGNLALNKYTTAGALVNDTSGNVTSDAELVVTKGYHTATMTPSTSGTITVTNNQMRYRKTGTNVHVNCVLAIGSVSSPVGTYISISLPFAVADLTGASERIGCAVRYFDSSAGTQTLLPIQAVASATSFDVYVDASVLAISDQFGLTFTYETT